MKPIYLDYAATTPLDKEVCGAMLPYMEDFFGNASSLHQTGQKAMRALDISREIIAKAIGAKFQEIVCTGSATEANNLALRGAIKRIKSQGLRIKEQQRIIISAIEHDSVLETARDLEREGVEVVYLPVDKNGVVDLKKLKASLNENTILVSVMYGNNVVGTIQPIAEIAKIIRDFRESLVNSHSSLWKDGYPLFHADAVQVFQYRDCDVNTIGVNMMTISSHKIYGPKGVGLLFSNVPLKSIITGGGQEFGLRSGTENIPAIVGFAKAVEEAVKIREKEAKRVEKLKEFLWKEIKKVAPEAIRNTPEKNALPHILNVAFPNASKNLVAHMDALGVAVSSGAACSARSQETSYVLRAMGVSEELARRSIRLSLGRGTMESEIKRVAKIVQEAERERVAK
ncbi:MAG: hypothetical protein A3D64_03260 [Candidatus Wildermuthbacteria bacterium RIFCSPHIGHO2_02_FULL_49_9]|uniref:Aminotransferase class V domain-containing protein n=2 Tax=Parcubacteria group TaxID=1794811 RepID=A0A1F6BWJ9_9BACT|nr:MAG: hypothetical protein A3A21_04240 [Candidatus Jorgensenbacteria bacterium RIFCSPLOWO2_01_FULL_45_25b]OHA70362.1 MAG: hypothetical protein A3D64_03260 [Candidatus Wildermuthbacteria bacterium RIFCSPHIGHO2_02_FULL_49_9]